MNKHLSVLARAALVAVGAAVVAASAFVAVGAQRGAAPAAAAPAPPPGPIRRMPEGKPDLTGFFQSDAGGSNYGIERHERDFLTPATRGVLIDPPDGILPSMPWARAERIERELPHRGYDDPTAHCFVAGVPRSMYTPSPYQILQFPNYVVILFERMSWRQIPLDGRTHLPDNVRLWQGDSVGHWEGDTLVVDTKNLNGKTWLNERGDVVSHAETVVERSLRECRPHHRTVTVRSLHQALT